MQLRFFTVPFHGGEGEAEDLNRFLAGQRILSIDRHFVVDGPHSAWAVCVAYEAAGEGRLPVSGDKGRRGKTDYREVLNEADFAVYARLRALRKELAEAEGLPAYAVFTNEQMAAMVQCRAATAADLKAIAGVGDARVEKYAEPFLAVLRGAWATASAATPPEAGEPVGAEGRAP